MKANDYMVGGMANGSYDSITHFVILDESLNAHPKKDQLLSYASYLLEYNEIPEVSDPALADYFVLVQYLDHETNSTEQTYQLTGFSKRVYNAIKEIRPSWQAVSKHFGKPSNFDMALAKHVLSVRNVVGSNAYRDEMGFKTSDADPKLLDLYASIEGKR